ncbi:MAG TPA: hypothetical protein VFU02_15950 [Polyangiaceae bacterium]|nr:hypothetical protein [Polyangiaceae bacterium]
MKAFASQVCFGVCVLLVGCGGDDDVPESTSTGGAGGATSSGFGGSATTGGSGGEAGAGGAPACDAPPSAAEIEIAGAFRDSYDGTHRIDDEVWQMGASSFDLVDFSNDERWAIAENAADNEFFPESFSRFEWTDEDGVLFYCQSVFAASSEDDAREAPRADASDLLAGCGNFAWSSLTPIALAGSYRDDFGGTHTITPRIWQSGSSLFHLLEFSNEDFWAVAQNDCSNAYFPGRYSRFDWVTVAGGEGGAAGAAGVAGAAGAGTQGSSETYFCQTGYDVDSAEAARELEPADRTDLVLGCSGFPWSKLSVPEL